MRSGVVVQEGEVLPRRPRDPGVAATGEADVLSKGDDVDVRAGGAQALDVVTG